MSGLRVCALRGTVCSRIVLEFQVLSSKYFLFCPRLDHWRSKGRTPTMKVFTVGLDQKPPMEKQHEPVEVVTVAPGTPPPIYPSDTLRKKKPYKGILLCMLGVFLLMLFVVTLSEMAYNRERDQNFLRLRWAELKHRMGYFENYNNEVAPERLSRIRPIESFNQMDATNPPTTSTPAPTTKAPEPETTDDDASSMDARLGFLKAILSKIKEKAEEMGMDGTMQVSVIRVEPEGDMDTNSDAFKDGFGEIHHPRFFQNNDVSDHEEQRPTMFGPWMSESAYNHEIPGMWHQQSRFGFGGNQELNRPFHMGSHEFEGRGKPLNQFMGEVYGRRFGRFLQELIARRMNNFQEMSPMAENMQFDPRFGQQQFFGQPWPQQEQQPQSQQQWWWPQQNQMQQQWWPQQQQLQPWFFDAQQPQRIQNHPEQQQLPPMIAMPQENQWSQPQQAMQGIPQIPQPQQHTAQTNQIFPQMQQQPQESQQQFPQFSQDIFAQQQQQPMIQNQQQQAQQPMFQIPVMNPSEPIQIDPPQQQKRVNDDWKSWVPENRAWTHQNVDQQLPQIQPDVKTWQLTQNQPSLEPSWEFPVEPAVKSDESAVAPAAAESGDEADVPFSKTSEIESSIENQLSENSVDDGNMHTIAPEADLKSDKVAQPAEESAPDFSESHLKKLRSKPPTASTTSPPSPRPMMPLTVSRLTFLLSSSQRTIT
ncbi:hypothetical protein L596_002947 [Steinernema carpocapsae]|uniref:Uncharacterized protein n=2 Tax=Steinernema carpocapsae TaxID=34508 RepID=A0A4U8UR53_STECR|nr:hypothetical protein L596_002947 [Steinernema carpocapsae]